MSKLAFSESIQNQLKFDIPYWWYLRDIAGHNLHYDIDDLGENESKLGSALDMIRILGNSEYELMDYFTLTNAGEIFVLTLHALKNSAKQNDTAEFTQLMEKIDFTEYSNSEIYNEITWAFTCLSKDKRNSWNNWLISSTEVRYQIVAIDSMVRCLDQMNAETLQKFCASPNERLLSASYRYMGTMRIPIEEKRISQLILQHSEMRQSSPEKEKSEQHDRIDTERSFEIEPHIYWAVWAGVIQQYPEAIEQMKTFSLEFHNLQEESILVLVSSLPTQEVLTYLEQLKEYSLYYWCLAVGYGGCVQHVPELINLMEDESCTLVAAEAFYYITNIDIENEELELSNDERERLQDQRHEMKMSLESGNPDKNLQKYTFERDDKIDMLLPDVQLLSKKWQTISNKFNSSNRYIAGKPLTSLDESKNSAIETSQDDIKHLFELLSNGKQPFRRLAAMYLMRADVKLPHFPVNAPVDCQRKILDYYSSLLSRKKLNSLSSTK